MSFRYLKFYPHGYDRDNYGYVAVALVLEELGNEESVFVQGDIFLSRYDLGGGNTFPTSIITVPRCRKRERFWN